MSFRDEEGIYHPANEDEIIALVCQARDDGVQIRVRGSAHSVAHAIYTDPLDKLPNKVAARGIRDRSNMNLDLDRYASYRVVPEREREIEVDAGMRLGDWVDNKTRVCVLGLLHSLSACQGWMLAGTGGIAHQTVAGFTATASAGGSLQRSVIDSICGFRLIDGLGEVWEVGEDDCEFAAMVPNLGLLGIVSTITFRCVEDFCVKGKQTTTTAGEAKLDLTGGDVSYRRSLRDFLEKTPFARVEWWPQRCADRVVIWEAGPESPPQEPWTADPYELFRGKDPQLVQALIGLTYTVLGNLDHLPGAAPGFVEILARLSDQLLCRILAELRDIGPGGVVIAGVIERAWTEGVDQALEAAQFEAAGLSDLIPDFFPKLVQWFVPPDTDEGPPALRGPQCFHDHAWRSLPMDHAVDDVYIPVEFTEIWVPLGRTDEVMRLLSAHFGECDTKESYRRTGTFAFELYVTKANRFWMNPAYTDGKDEWVAGAFRVNPFWYGRNAGDPAARFFRQFWDLLRDAGVPFRLHWGKFLPLVAEDPSWVGYLRAQYPHWQTFLDLRARRDPRRIFLNEYWCRHLGLDNCEPPRHRITDLHCHYPMHVLADRREPAVSDRKSCSRPRWWWLDGLRAAIFNLFARAMNHSPSRPRWRVDFDGLKDAGTGIVLSVLYDPGLEVLVWPLSQHPRKWSFQALLCQLTCVEKEIQRLKPVDGCHPRVVKTVRELDAAIDSGQMAFVHCVEGGFHLGGEANRIAERVQLLRERGVVYITLAHLFYRGVATNTSAIPWVSDKLYDAIFWQRGKGLSALGAAAVTAMYEHRMLIDVCHMDADALKDTFDLLNSLDRCSGADPADHPVIATHAGYRFGEQEYMLDRETITEIARRGGVIGLILAGYQLRDGLGGSATAEQAFQTVCCHINAIYEITGSHAYTSVGSDLDGFIKPIAGIEGPADLQTLAGRLHRRYPADADAILFKNAERVVRTALRRA